MLGPYIFRKNYKIYYEGLMFLVRKEKNYEQENYINGIKFMWSNHDCGKSDGHD